MNRRGWYEFGTRACASVDGVCWQRVRVPRAPPASAGDSDVGADDRGDGDAALRSPLVVITDAVDMDGSFVLCDFARSEMAASGGAAAAAAFAQHAQTQMQTHTQSPSQLQPHVRIVSTDRTYLHYASVLRKLGVDVKAAAARGAFSFVDCLEQVEFAAPPITSTLAYKSPLALNIPVGVAPAGAAAGGGGGGGGGGEFAHVRHFALGSDADGGGHGEGGGGDGDGAGGGGARHSTASSALRTLLRVCTEAWPESGAPAPTCVIVDCVNTLAEFHSVPEALTFMQYLRVHAVATGGLVVALVHNDAPDDPASGELAAALRHAADFAMDVRGLETGVSRDVHGQLLIEESETTGAPPSTLRLHFKCFDNGAHYFPPGVSV